jgi:hypothetical protein
MSVTGGDVVIRNLEAYTAELQKRANDAMEAVMSQLEAWAKSEHGAPGGPVGAHRTLIGGIPHNEPHEPPFWDETGNTTNSIRSEVIEATQEVVRGLLTAGMEYDVYLELARNGKWGFLWKTVERHKDDIYKIIVAIMGGGKTSVSLSPSPRVQDAYEGVKAATRARRQASRARHTKNVPAGPLRE